MRGGQTITTNLQLAGGTLEISDRLFAKPRDDRAEDHERALHALDEAINQTTNYLRDIETGKTRYNQYVEQEISHLWQHASEVINSLDPELANVCYLKSQGWLDPKVWNHPEFRSFKLGLDHLRRARMDFNLNFHPNLQATNRLPESLRSDQDGAVVSSVPSWYPIAGVLFFAATLLILLFLIFGPDRSSRTPLINILIAFGFAGSVAFIGGTAAAKGKIPIRALPNHPLEFSVTGGVASFVIALSLMFWLNPMANERQDVTAPKPEVAEGAMRAPQVSSDERRAVTDAPKRQGTDATKRTANKNIAPEIPPEEGQNIQKLMDDLCSRGVLLNDYNWEMMASVHASVAEIQQELEQSIQNLPLGSQARVPLHDMEEAARQMLQNPLVFPENSPDPRPVRGELLAQISAFRALYRKHMDMLTKNYGLTQTCEVRIIAP